MCQFTESVARHCDGMHVAPGSSATCPECLEAYGISERDERGRFRSVDAMQEELYELESGSFSWHECDTCGSRLGGDRHEAHGEINGGWYHLSVCTDCLLYFANGDIPETWEG